MKKRRTLEVGVFVFAALVLGTIAVFMIGDNRRLWDPKVTVNASFNDVLGLKAGSMVRMGGVDVGTVKSVKHGDDPADPKIYVQIALARTEARRVHADTVAKVVNKGLLGDKMLELVGGTLGSDAVKEGGWIASEQDPADFGKAMNKLDAVADKADKTMDAVKRTSESLADPKLAEDIKGSVTALRTILDGVANNKDGAAHKVIFDAEEGRRIDRILANLDATTQNLAKVTADAREVTDRAKTGPGLVHTLVYDDKLAENTAGTIAEVNGALRAVRTGNGLAHTVVYGDDSGSGQKMMTNLAVMSEDLRKITGDLRAGRGTIGGLLVDPSVYEDVKGIVGNVERNQVLRALVRYSIKQNEDRRPDTVADPGGASAPSPARATVGTTTAPTAPR